LLNYIAIVLALPIQRITIAHQFAEGLFPVSRTTEWLSGSGGTGETPSQLLHILAKHACAERRSRCPTGAGVGPVLQNGFEFELTTSGNFCIFRQAGFAHLKSVFGI
jgi:hypothetical protein